MQLIDNYRSVAEFFGAKELPLAAPLGEYSLRRLQATPDAYEVPKHCIFDPLQLVTCHARDQQNCVDQKVQQAMDESSEH
mmetsp:Transcript_14900/g.18711  ORF Transcript_14900/g.18711 Transcript_14900/m.18711 type:complete len:80 (-) Transcript_14900:3-242(-)